MIMQQKNMCRLWGDRDETVNPTLNEYRKLAQKRIWLCGKSNPLDIVQEIMIWSYNQMKYTQIKIYPREWHS